jgi:hypothetical protein
MAIRLIRQLAIVAGLLVLLVRPSDLASCGPFFRVAVFTRLTIPENEKAFFSGQIGILQPSYRRRYLALSYRILKGIPLSPLQVASIPPTPAFDYRAANTPLDLWELARIRVPAVRPVRIDPYHDGANYTRYLNCGDDAFSTATATLNERIRLAGAASPEVHDWLESQDHVFASCDGKGEPPAPARPGSSARIVADREYQIAAANFYLGHYDEPNLTFQKIAAAASPWHSIAPYLAARADIRNADYETAQSELKAILGDPKLVAIHGKAAALLDYLDARMEPEAHFVAAAKRLLIRDSPTLAHDLTDYTFLYDKLEPIKKPQDEVTDWIEEFRGGDEEELVKRWQQEHALPWLVAALYHADTATSQPDDLIEAARRVPLDSPAWATVRFHAIRLLTVLDRNQDARQMLSEVTSHLQGAPASVSNSFGAEQLKVARTLGEFLAAAPRILAGTIDIESETDASEHTQLPMFDSDAVTAFDPFLPLKIWLLSIRENRLPPRLRSVLAQAAFVRAVLLDDRLAPEFARLLRELKPSYAAGMDAYLAQANESRRFEAAFWILHHPEASLFLRGDYPRASTVDVPDGTIDSYRDNWWCAMAEPNVQFTPPAFLTNTDREQAKSQRQALIKTGSGTTFLSRTVLAWSRSHPNDPRLPEALALAVKTSHFGCTNPDSAGPVSEAFRVLHTRFPNSPWTKQTPYWYR